RNWRNCATGRPTCRSSARPSTRRSRSWFWPSISDLLAGQPSQFGLPRPSGYNAPLKLALVGFGNVGHARPRLLHRHRPEVPFVITGIHTLRHGTAIACAGLPPDPVFGPRLASIDDFLEAAGAGIMVELTTLNPGTGEPAISHIRAAFAHGMHVVTANKGPVA